jgi:hypothetical protein
MGSLAGNCAWGAKVARADCSSCYLRHIFGHKVASLIGRGRLKMRVVVEIGGLEV